MRRALARVPLLVVLAGVLCVSMQVPAIHALTRDAHAVARAFFYSGVLGLAAILAIGLATNRSRSSNITRSHLLALLGAFALLPALAAVPFAAAVPDTRPVNAWLEMVAAATTTGGSLYVPARLPDSVHLWRALVAWQGGLLIWVAAAAILAPLRLGGFEVVESRDITATLPTYDRRATPEHRLYRAAAGLTPVYVVLTGILWLALALAGDPPVRAAIHAMSVLSTSGITAGGGLAGSPAGFGGELVVFAFLMLAVSRQTFATDLHRARVVRLSQDRELRMALAIIGTCTAVLFLRHWIGAFEVDRTGDAAAALRAVWGAAFTTLSYLTTTGFVSADWATSRAWSGLEAPAVLLMGLAMFGGGVATTAGGVKLLRIYALYSHGRRELNLAVHPHSIASGRGAAGGVRAQGAVAAWIFFMLFAVTIAITTLALALTGFDFTTALVLATAALSTTGPLAELALGPVGPVGQGLGALSDTAKVVLAAAMVVGRLETLALIALFNPDFWRG